MEQQTNSFEGYESPTTSTQEVLLTLILQGSVSIFDFPYLSGFRTRVSNLCLNYGLNLERITSTKHKVWQFLYLCNSQTSGKRKTKCRRFI